jgi:putative ABC transport system permease protein
MLALARKNLLADKIRLAISIGGVAFAVLLILVVQGLYSGFSKRIGGFAERVPADIWVTQRDAHGFTYASAIPEGMRADVAAVDGIALVVPLYAERVQVTSGGGRSDVYVAAFDLPAGSTIGGFDFPQPGTIVLDSVFARDNGLRAGDRLNIRGRDFTIAKVAELADAGLSQFTLMAVEDARPLIAIPGYVDYLLVRTTPGADIPTVAAAIAARHPELQASSKADFAAANRAEVRETFRPIVGVLFVVVFAVGIAVVGLTIYTATIERSREYGMLKALGATGGDLFGIVLSQSVVVCAVGSALGVPLAIVVNRAAQRYVPEFITLLQARDVVLVALAAAGMSAVAALIPLRRIVALDPVAVFRA